VIGPHTQLNTFPKTAGAGTPALPRHSITPATYRVVRFGGPPDRCLSRLIAAH